MPLITFLVKKECLLHRPVLIFQPAVNSSASDKQNELCLQLYQSGGTKYAVTICQT